MALIPIVLPSKKAFRSTWKTDNTSTGSSDNNQVKLPLQSAGDYNFIVKWGDGTQNHIKTWNQSEVTHTYAASGTYDIEISGIIKGWQFGGSNDCKKILTIRSFGGLVIISDGAFQGCSNLVITALDELKINANSLYATFYFCEKLTRVPKMDTKNIINFTSMFQYANIQGPLTIDTRNATALTTLLYNNRYFNSPINHLDTSKNTSMAYFLSGDYDAAVMRFNQSFEGINTSKVTNMAYMLYNCQFFNHSLAGIDIQLVSNMTDMLYRCFAWSTENYSNTLISWANQNVQDGVTFRCSSKYNASAVAARDHLTGTHGWTINDLGLE